MVKKKFGFSRLFSKSDKDCCSVEIEEVKKEENTGDKEPKSKKVIK